MHAFSTASSEQGRGFGTAMVFRLKSLHESAAQLVAQADFGPGSGRLSCKSCGGPKPLSLKRWTAKDTV